MTAPAWPPEATCGRCKWWGAEYRDQSGFAPCKVALKDGAAVRTVGDFVMHTHETGFGCRAWEEKKG